MKFWFDYSFERVFVGGEIDTQKNGSFSTSQFTLIQRAPTNYKSQNLSLFENTLTFKLVFDFDFFQGALDECFGILVVHGAVVF